MVQMGQDLVNGIRQIGRGAQGADQGYCHLKPKMDITKVTCDGAEGLMIELVQFEVDMGELGVSLLSEAAYRQLRAVAVGKARDVLDLENVRGGVVTQLRLQLDQAVATNQPQQLRDQIGGQLYANCCVALAQAVRLTPEKRLEIAERVDHEAKMHGDSVVEAEAFLSRWRRARHLMYREGLVNQPSANVQYQMEQATCPQP